MSRSPVVQSIALLVGLSLTCVAGAQQEPAAASKPSLLAALEAATETLFPHAMVTRIEAEENHGVRTYGIDLRDGQAEASMDVAEDGTVIAVETAIEAKDLPKAVADAIAKAAPAPSRRSGRRKCGPGASSRSSRRPASSITSR